MKSFRNDWAGWRKSCSVDLPPYNTGASKARRDFVTVRRKSLCCNAEMGYNSPRLHHFGIAGQASNAERFGKEP